MLLASKVYIYQLRIKQNEISFMVNSIFRLDLIHPESVGSTKNSPGIKANNWLLPQYNSNLQPGETVIHAVSFSVFDYSG